MRFHGHAIECRINAENPVSFRPSPGKIVHYHPPGGLGVRVDLAVYQGYTIPPYYDSLVGKLIVHGKTRQECLMRLRRALDEFVVDGIETTLPLFRALVRERGHHRRRLSHPLARAVPRARRDELGVRRQSVPPLRADCRPSRDSPPPSAPLTTVAEIQHSPETVPPRLTSGHFCNVIL